MSWISSIGEAIAFIEDNLTQELSIKDIAGKVHISPFYFQKGFAMLCGFTVSDYVRCRRLASAGSELATGDVKIIDLALKYGYDSPDSFTKAFTRFHGATPTAVRKSGATIKSFAPLKVKFVLEGGYSMDYKIVEKDSFTVIGLAQSFQYEEAATAVPQLWAQFVQSTQGSNLCSTYGINIDEAMSGNEFEYLIADDYRSGMTLPAGFVSREIPAFTWAVFPCKGPMPQAMQNLNKRIFSEWLPGSGEYSIAAGYCVEHYSDPANFPKGTDDESYTCEMWIPVTRK